MTTQYAVLKGLPNGLAFDSAKLFTVASPDTLVTGNTFSFSNRTNANTQYVVSIVRSPTPLPAGDYTLICYIASVPRAEIAVTFAGTDGETATETARLAVLDPAVLDPVLEAIEALESASANWTEEEKAQIRYRLGLDGTATAPEDPEADPIVITPATGIMTTGYLVTRVKGVPTAGITIRYQQAQEPAADRGSSYDDTIYSAVSNSEGIAELSLVKGGLYYVWRSASTRPMNVAPYRVLKVDGSAPDATLALPSHVGA